MSQYTRAIWKKVARNAGDALIVLGFIVISIPLIWSLKTSYLQQREVSEWEEEEVEQKTLPPPRQPDYTYWPKTKIVIDRIDLEAVVVEGVNDDALERGPMHLAGTAGPGQPGNCCIAAHKEKWFKKLRVLEQGDTVLLKTFTNDYIYLVDKQKTVDPKDIQTLKQTPSPTITLITCTGLPYGGSKHRLVVTGKLGVVVRRK